jgi:hypothetical protein
MKRNWHILLHLLFGLAVVGAFGAIVMCLWNGLAPTIWGCPVISFWQATGLFILCRILFGSFGGGHHFKQRSHEKWMKMTPEERKRFIRHQHHEHGFGCFDHDVNKEEESEKKD